MSLRYWRCPICGESVFVKTAYLHLEGHRRFEPGRVAEWWERQEAARNDARGAVYFPGRAKRPRSRRRGAWDRLLAGLGRR